MKLEREVSAQKPKLRVVGQKKEELSKRLNESIQKEAELNKNIEVLSQEGSSEEVKQIISDALRMKQLEVSCVPIPFRFIIFFIE